MRERVRERNREQERKENKVFPLFPSILKSLNPFHSIKEERKRRRKERRRERRREKEERVLIMVLYGRELLIQSRFRILLKV